MRRRCGSAARRATATGSPPDDDRRAECNPPLKRAKITDYVRPFHDGRHTSITNSAAGGMEPMKMMKRAGHADLSTTMIDVELGGETFPEAAELLEERLFGQKLGQKS